MAVDNHLGSGVWLPQELIVQIVSNLTLQELGRANGVNKNWKRASDADAIWKAVLKNLWGQVKEDPSHFSLRDFTDLSSDDSQFKYREFFKKGANLSLFDQEMFTKNYFNFLVRKGIFPEEIRLINLDRTHPEKEVKHMSDYYKKDFYAMRMRGYSSNCECKKLLLITQGENQEQRKRVEAALLRWLVATCSIHPAWRKRFGLGQGKRSDLEKFIWRGIFHVMDPKGRVQLDKLKFALMLSGDRYNFPGPLELAVKLYARSCVTFPKNTSRDAQGTINVEILDKASEALEQARRHPTVVSYTRQVVSYVDPLDLMGGAGFMYWATSSTPSHWIFTFVVMSVMLFTLRKFYYLIFDDYRRHHKKQR